MKQCVYIVVTPFFPSPNNWRGAYCLDFVKALERGLGRGEREERGEWKVLVFKPGNGADYEIDGVKVYRFPTRQLPSNVLPFLFRRYNTRSFLNKLKEVTSALQLQLSTSTTLIAHAHTANFAIYPLALKKLNPNCKTFLHHHDLMSFGLNNGRLRHFGFYNRIMARQLKRLHEQIDCHVFISRLCQRSFESFPNIDWLGDADYSAQARGVKNMPPVRIKRSIILHNGVDTSIFHPTPQPQPLTSTFKIGCIGNIEPEKGQYDLLCALKLVKGAGYDVCCRMIGSGSDMERCQAFARDNGLAVEFLPEMRHEQLPDFYRSLNLFVLPTWLDGFGCVYTEAYACGVPFIATTNAGVEDMIPESDRDRWLCKPHDIQGLADKIVYFIAYRPVQNLKGRYAIDQLVNDFVGKVIRHD